MEEHKSEHWIKLGWTIWQISFYRGFLTYIFYHSLNQKIL